MGEITRQIIGEAKPSNVRLFEMYDRYDCFHIARTTLQGQLRLIFEAWFPDRKEEIVQKMRQKGFELTDHDQIGDYDLALWTCKTDPQFFGMDTATFISLNVGQHDPGEPDEQAADTETGKIPIRAIASKVSQWAHQYGKLAVSSYLPQRTAKYYKFVVKLLPDCRVSWINAGQPDAGFFVEPR